MKSKKHNKDGMSSRIMSAMRELTKSPHGESPLTEAAATSQDGRGEPAPAETAGAHVTNLATLVGTFDVSEAQARLRFFADMGTALWRLRQKMVRPGSNDPLDEMRRAYRHFESAWSLLQQAGVEIQDHTDRLFDAGMELSVLTFQPMPELKHELVVETIKPTIYYKKVMIQRGEVIVGTPEASA